MTPIERINNRKEVLSKIDENLNQIKRHPKEDCIAETILLLESLARNEGYTESHLSSRIKVYKKAARDNQ
jgi:hypothetical protein